jgi:hypothetical protein
VSQAGRRQFIARTSRRTRQVKGQAKREGLRREDRGGRRPIPVKMWDGGPSPGADVGRGEPSPGADVERPYRFSVRRVRTSSSPMARLPWPRRPSLQAILDRVHAGEGKIRCDSEPGFDPRVAQTSDNTLHPTTARQPTGHKGSLMKTWRPEPMLNRKGERMGVIPGRREAEVVVLLRFLRCATQLAA